METLHHRENSGHKRNDAGKHKEEKWITEKLLKKSMKKSEKKKI